MAQHAFDIARPANPAHCVTLLGGVELFCDPAGGLFWPDESLLVVSDLHLEKGSSFASRGSMIPPYDTAVTLGALAACIARWNPRKVISLGDSFHDGNVSGRMPELFRVRLAAMMAGREWIWVSGNHDPEPPQGVGGDCADEVVIGPLTFRHEPARRFAIGEVAGHLHPEARIVRRGRAVRRKCFATDCDRLVMPSFGAYTGGLSIRDRAFHGLFDETGLHAHLLGRARMYTIAGRDIV